MLILGFSSCGSSPVVPEKTVDSFLYYNGTILTMDPDQPEAAAMVVQNGHVAAVGELADLEEIFPNVHRLDLQQRVLLPGVIDSHVHVVELGERNLKANLVGAESVEEMIKRLRTFAPDPQPGQWLIGKGWDEGVWASMGYPDRQLLDEAFPDHPVFFESLHGFASFCNSKTLAAAGIDNNTPNPEGGTILRRQNGEATGILLAGAQKLVRAVVPPPNLEQTKACILEGTRLMAAAGVTSIHEAGMTPLRVQAFQELASEGKLPIRVYGMLDGNNRVLMNQWFERGPLIDPESMFMVRSIKVFYDGSLGSRTALMKEPYSDKPEEANMSERIGIDRIRELALQAAQKGFQMAVHAIGDEGNDRVLALYEEVLRDFPDLDHRWRIEHAQVVLPDYYERAAKLGVISSMQSSHAVGDSKWAEDRVGPQRIRNAYAWRYILNAGAPLIMNSDLPGEPWEPWYTLYFGVTRQNAEGKPEGGWYPDQAMTVMEMLHAMTTAGAHAGFMEDHLGSLKPGAFADFVELDHDPRSQKPEQLQNAWNPRTRVAGKRVFDQ